MSKVRESYSLYILCYFKKQKHKIYNEYEFFAQSYLISSIPI